VSWSEFCQHYLTMEVMLGWCLVFALGYIYVLKRRLRECEEIGEDLYAIARAREILLDPDAKTYPLEEVKREIENESAAPAAKEKSDTAFDKEA